MTHHQHRLAFYVASHLHSLRPTNQPTKQQRNWQLLWFGANLQRLILHIACSGGPTSWCSLARRSPAPTPTCTSCALLGLVAAHLPASREVALRRFSHSVCWLLDLLPALILSSRSGGRSLLSRTAALVHAPHRRRGHFLSNRPARPSWRFLRLNQFISSNQRELAAFDRLRLPCRHPPGEGCAQPPLAKLWGRFFYLSYCRAYVLIAVDGACNEPISAVWSIWLCFVLLSQGSAPYIKKSLDFDEKKVSRFATCFQGCWQEKTNKNVRGLKAKTAGVWELLFNAENCL